MSRLPRWLVLSFLLAGGMAGRAWVLESDRLMATLGFTTEPPAVADLGFSPDQPASPRVQLIPVAQSRLDLVPVVPDLVATDPPLVQQVQFIEMVPPPSSGVITGTGEPGEAVQPWGGVEHQTGPGVGYQTSFTTIRGFLPWQRDQSVFFLDLSGFLNNDVLTGGNLGGGWRYYDPSGDRLWGANLFIDLRETENHTFHQVGLGFESLGRVVDWRANVYLPVSDRQQETYSLFSNPAYLGYNLQLDRLEVGEAAMGGFDTEAGVPLSCDYGVKAYGGMYHFQVGNSPQAWGVRGRLEWRPTENLNLNLVVSNDQVFDTTVVFQGGFRFGGRASRDGAARCDTYARRVDPVERNHNIVVVDQIIFTQELACDLTTNQPIMIFHADSNAAAGGNGTFERPFNTLAGLQNGSTPNTILLGHGGSVFNSQQIALQHGQRILGDGADCRHFLTACQGVFQLPRANGNPNQPLISNSPGNAITLANINEVSGWVITKPGLNGIYGNGLTHVNLNCNTITGAANVAGGGNGIFLGNFNGFGSIRDNVASFNGVSAPGQNGNGNGILLAGTSFTGEITGNTTNNNGTGGDATVVATAPTGFKVPANATAGNGNGNGILFNVTTFRGDVTGNTANGNGTGGQAVATATVGSGDARVFNLVEAVGGAGNGSGIAINAATFQGNVTGNSASGNGKGGNATGLASATGGVDDNQTDNKVTAGAGNGSGILLNIETFKGNVAGNVANGNGVGGDYTSTATAQGGSNFTFGAARIGSAGDGNGSGIQFNGKTFQGDVSSNTASGNGIGGNATATASSSGDADAGARAGLGNGSGISFNLETFTGKVQGNIANGNGLGGNASANGQATGTGASTVPFATATAGAGNGRGIAFKVTSFQGDVTGNSANGNALGGNASAVANASGGGLVQATASATGGTGNGSGLLLSGTTITGNVTGNTANGNATGGSGSATANSLNGSGQSSASADAFAGQSNGAGIFLEGESFTGDVTGNTANSNAGISNVSSVAIATGLFNNLASTTTTTFASKGAGILSNVTTFNGNVTGNTTNGNGKGGDVNFVTNATGGAFNNQNSLIVFSFLGTPSGIGLLGSDFNGLVSSNIANANGLGAQATGGPNGGGFPPSPIQGLGVGILLRNNGTGLFDAHLTNNTLNDNGSGRGLLAFNADTGDMCILLDGNTSTPVQAGPAVNYFLLNGFFGGSFIFQDVGNNVGSIGTLGTVTTGVCP